MRFHLELQLGDDSMQTGQDIARVLRKTADRLSVREGLLEKSLDELGVLAISDDNGNRIGIAFLSQQIGPVRIGVAPAEAQ